jgi:hypothetical protein
VADIHLGGIHVVEFNKLVEFLVRFLKIGKRPSRKIIGAYLTNRSEHNFGDFHIVSRSESLRQAGLPFWPNSGASGILHISVHITCGSELSS